MDQICIFRVESLQLSHNDDPTSVLQTQDSSLIAKIDQHETNVDISSSFVPRKVSPIVGFTNEFDSLYQIISTLVHLFYFLVCICIFFFFNFLILIFFPY